MVSNKLLVAALVCAVCAPRGECEAVHELLRPGSERKTFADVRYGGLIRQKFTSTCGAASLAQILQHFDPSITSEDPVLAALKTCFPREKFGGGITLEQMVATATRLAPNLESSAIVCSADAVLACSDPVLILTEKAEMGHYMVCYGMQDGRVRLADPQFGWRTLPTGAFKKIFTGFAIVVYRGKRK